MLRVTYKVEATRVEQRTDFDRLILDVETKPCMRPRDAVASAGMTLVELFGLARELNLDAEGIDIGPSPTDAALAADLALLIEELNLTVRSYNCLKREGIHTVGELVARSEQDLLDIRNFGAKSIEEVKQKLTDMGLALKDSPPGFDPGTAADSYGADDEDDYVETEAVLTTGSPADTADGSSKPRRTLRCPRPLRAAESAAAQRISSTCWPTLPLPCSSTARSPRPRRRARQAAAARRAADHLR